jgi:hypothetical protein
MILSTSNYSLFRLDYKELLLTMFNLKTLVTKSGTATIFLYLIRYSQIGLNR